MYKVAFTATASKEFKTIDKRYLKALSQAIDRLADNPSVGTPLVRKLKGYWKLRFSRYRIVYMVQQPQKQIVIFDIRHRKEVYR